MTFSATQVRKPPSADHLDSTSPYAGWLTPFDAALAAHPVDPATGAWLGEGGEPETDPADRPPESAGMGGLMRRLFGGKTERDAP